jgi:hypothetical protein
LAGNGPLRSPSTLANACLDKPSALSADMDGQKVPPRGFHLHKQGYTSVATVKTP